MQENSKHMPRSYFPPFKRTAFKEALFNELPAQNGISHPDGMFLL